MMARMVRAEEGRCWARRDAWRRGQCQSGPDGGAPRDVHAQLPPNAGETVVSLYRNVQAPPTSPLPLGEGWVRVVQLGGPSPRPSPEGRGGSASSSISTTCSRRGPCAPSSSVCSISAERDGPVTSMTLRGMPPISARSRSHASSYGPDHAGRAQHHDRRVRQQVERGRPLRARSGTSASRSRRWRRKRAAR